MLSISTLTESFTPYFGNATYVPWEKTPPQILMDDPQIYSLIYFMYTRLIPNESNSILQFIENLKKHFFSYYWFPE